MEDLSVFVRYYPDKNFESQLSADKKILVKVWALVKNGEQSLNPDFEVVGVVLPSTSPPKNPGQNHPD